MKNGQKPFRHTHVLRTAIAGAALALLAACGGGGGSGSSSSTPASSSNAAPASGVSMQVVAFGTSLSDAGTYSPEIAVAFGGGRFTTNPGQVWTQNVAQYFGNTLTPAFEGGFGLPLTASGGLDYAQGGAQVSLGGNINAASATEMPVTWQIQQYLSQHGSFGAGQLVLVEGGANEILNFAQSSTFAAFGAALQAAEPALAAQVPTLIASGAFPNTAAGQSQAMAYLIGQWMLSQASTYPMAAAIIQAAQTMAQQVVTQVVAKGATDVAVVDVPDIGQTPAAVAANQASPGAAALLTAITGAYNVTLFGALTQGMTAAITATPALASVKVVPVDTFTWFDTEIANYQSAGFTVSNTATACNLSQMQANATAYATSNPGVLTGTGLTAAQYGAQFASSLFCSPQTLVAANAATTYMFADSVHPTTALHQDFAQFVETTLAGAGIGKAP